MRCSPFEWHCCQTNVSVVTHQKNRLGLDSKTWQNDTKETFLWSENKKREGLFSERDALTGIKRMTGHKIGPVVACGGRSQSHTSYSAYTSADKQMGEDMVVWYGVQEGGWKKTKTKKLCWLYCNERSMLCECSSGNWKRRMTLSLIKRTVTLWPSFPGCSVLTSRLVK